MQILQYVYHLVDGTDAVLVESMKKLAIEILNPNKSDFLAPDIPTELPNLTWCLPLNESDILTSNQLFYYNSENRELVATLSKYVLDEIALLKRASRVPDSLGLNYKILFKSGKQYSFFLFIYFIL